MALTEYGEKLVDMAISYAPKLVLALLVLIVGWIAAGWISNVLAKRMKKRLDGTLAHFLKSLVNIGLKAMLLISVVSMLGVATTSFIAVLGAAGLAVGLALQGSLANFAGGVLIAVFKPYVVGEYIDAQGYQGTVERVEIFNTILKTADNQVITIPNGLMSNGPIQNVTREKTRRVDMVFGISYSDDIRKASDVLTDIAKRHPKVLKDPAPQVVVGELADSGVNFKVRPWTKTEDYWGVYFDITRAVKERFDKEGISIPYPQMDVHMQKG